MKSGLFLTLLVTTFLVQSSVHAQRVPLPMVNEAPVLDQFQQPLPRAAALVQVLACHGVKHPPNPFNGAPHPENPVLYSTVVGAGIHPRIAHAGFAAFITPRPAEPFFVRVYNALAMENSTFYADSDVFTPSLAVDALFYPELTAATNPVNPAVAAGGLTVSMKQSLGLNPYVSDTDGDGIDDADELRMGTDALSPASYMPPIEIHGDPVGTGVLKARWNLSAVDRGVMAATGMEVMSQQEVAQIFSNARYRFEQSASPGDFAEWVEVPGSASTVFNRWPPAIGMPDMPEGVQFFRLRID